MTIKFYDKHEHTGHNRMWQKAWLGKEHFVKPEIKAKDSDSGIHVSFHGRYVYKKHKDSSAAFAKIKSVISTALKKYESRAKVESYIKKHLKDVKVKKHHKHNHAKENHKIEHVRVNVWKAK